MAEPVVYENLVAFGDIVAFGHIADHGTGKYRAAGNGQKPDQSGEKCQPQTRGFHVGGQARH